MEANSDNQINKVLEVISAFANLDFSKRNTGTISVQLKNKKGEGFILSIEDNGIGFPATKGKNSQSFDLQLIDSLSGQINGNIRFESGRNGTKYRISFPSKN